MGPDGGLFALIYRLVPAIDFMRAPARAGMWAMFSFSAVAGLSLSHLQQMDFAAARRVLSKWSPWVIAFGAGAGLIGAAAARMAFDRSPAEPDAARLYHLAGDLVLFAVLFCKMREAVRVK